jgi:hypothetical protein
VLPRDRDRPPAKLWVLESAIAGSWNGDCQRIPRFNAAGQAGGAKRLLERFS